MILKIMCNHKDNLQPTESNSHITEVTNNAIPQVTDLQQYQFVRDKERRQVRPPARYAYADIVVYALISGEDVSIKELDSYK